jgi:hypothetical protein
MEKVVKVENDHEDGYNVMVGQKTYHVHAERFPKPSNAACVAHGRRTDAIKIIVSVHKEIIDADTMQEIEASPKIKKIVKRAVEEFLENGVVKCDLCLDLEIESLI